MSTTPVWFGAQAKKGNVFEQSDNVQLVQARMVQHHYVRAQIRNINGKEQQLVAATIAALKKNDPKLKDASDARLLERFNKMTAKLQEANLAINFSAEGFFKTPNNSDSYSQMYERASVVNSQLHLAKNANNTAQKRLEADDVATFSAAHKSASWGGVQRVMNPLHAGYAKAPGANGATNYTHQTKGAADLMNDGVAEIENPYFNPKTKEVFAALHYGKQAHGPAPEYGASYFVLNKKYKTNALYFAGDTFLHEFGYRVKASDQVSYQMLGALYAVADTKFRRLRKALEDVCFYNQVLSDNPAECAYYLIEAHLFEPLYFSGGIDHIYLSRRTKGKGDLDKATWEDVQKNAKDFAKRHGAKLHLLSGFRW